MATPRLLPRHHNHGVGPASQRLPSPASTIRRTGRLLTPSMPVSSSTLPARPPQPSCRMRSMVSRISISPWGMCVSAIIRSLPQRSHTMRRNHDGNARRGSSRASWAVGSGSLP
jgi:hypothetical protein